MCSGLRLAPIGSDAAAMLEPVWHPIAPGGETPNWLDCRNETDAAVACWRVLEDFRAVGEGPDLPRLAVLTSRATSAGGRAPLPAQAALVGLVATLVLERPELRPVLLDLDAGETPPPIPLDADSPILAWRDGTLLMRRLEFEGAAAPACRALRAGRYRDGDLGRAALGAGDAADAGAGGG